MSKEDRCPEVGDRVKLAGQPSHTYTVIDIQTDQHPTWIRCKHEDTATKQWFGIHELEIVETAGTESVQKSRWTKFLGA